MEWVKYEVFTESEKTEIIAAELLDLGIEGAQIKDDYETRLFLESGAPFWDYADEELLNAEKGEASVVFYVGKDSDTELFARIDETFKGYRVEKSIEDDYGWLNEWKKYYKPFRLGKRVIVRPEWEDAGEIVRDGDVVFSIEPGHVFGTGLHESTSMCVEFLEEVVEDGKNIIDIGCGSGILAITALLLGAESAVCADIDEFCVRSAKKNAELNNVAERIRFFCGDVISDASAREKAKGIYDIVTANIIADVVIALAPIAAGITRKGSAFICSGIIREKESAVVSALRENGFAIGQIKREGEWVCILAAKGE
ncbi:ribosomal protein L11 methyltransferase [Clostridia bacterium]|nr:ribosomal protein L11 methyltransferase [Clostridia bacterium]